MSNLAGALELLEDVTSRFPPGENQRHALLIVDGKLSLQLWQGPGQCRLYTIENSDVCKHAYELMSDLEDALGMSREDC